MTVENELYEKISASELSSMINFINRSKNNFPTPDLLKELYILEGKLPEFMEHCFSKLNREDLEVSEDRFKELMQELILKKEFLYNLLRQFSNSFQSCKCIYGYLLTEIEKFSNEIEKSRRQVLFHSKNPLN